MKLTIAQMARARVLLYNPAAVCRPEWGHGVPSGPAKWFRVWSSEESYPVGRPLSGKCKTEAGAWRGAARSLPK